MSTLEEIQSKLLEMSLTTTNEYIPIDVIVEILSRLPGKSLIRFRWACKYWFQLITKDSSFAKLQLLNHAINNPLLMCPSYTTSTAETKSLVFSFFNYCTELVDDDEGSHSLLPIATRFIELRGEINGTVVGSCNGLLCIRRWTMYKPIRSAESTLCIWNPCTNEFKESSVEPILEFPEGTIVVYYNVGYNLYGFGYDHIYNLYGFGYDQTIDDYKVISNANLLVNVDYVSVAKVYTLGTNSWKRIENYHPFHLMTKFIGNNGAFLYCIGSKSLSRSHLDVIVCFDIAKEEYREISKPWFVGDLDFMDLIELNGCLGLAQPNNSSQSWVMEVWMMKDYCHDNMNKNEYSWTKLYTIREPNILRYGFKSLGISSKNGDEILIQLRSIPIPDIYWYNEKDDKVRKSRSLMFCGNLRNVETYIESLVSLNSGTYMCDHEEPEEEEEQQEGILN